MGAEIAVFGIYLDSLILIIFVKVYQIKLRELPDIKRCNIRVLYLYNIKIVCRVILHFPNLARQSERADR